MNFLSGLMDDLDLLTTSLDDPTVDLSRLTREFVSDFDDVAAAVTTVSITVDIGGVSLRVAAATERDRGGVAATSLRVNLIDERPTGASAHIVLRSDEAGSLDALAADASAKFGDDAVQVDHQLEVDTSVGDESTDTARSLASGSDTERAVGVMIDGGRTAAESRAEMRRLATLDGVPVVDVARRVLRDAAGWHPPASRST